LETFQESRSEERRYSSRFSEFTGSRVWGLLSGLQGVEIAIFKHVKVNSREEGIIWSLVVGGYPERNAVKNHSSQGFRLDMNKIFRVV